MSSLQYLNRSQQLALASDRHILVAASAGSGKTSILVERYVQLLLSGVDVRSIVAITFTKKAASEMLVRVARKLDERNAQETNPNKLRQLRAIRERLPNASISTIHSFCQELLQEFPIESGLPPGFSIINEGERLLLKQHAVRQAIEEELLLDTERVSGLRQTILKTGIDSFEEGLLQCLDKTELIDTCSLMYSTHSDEEIIARALSSVVSTLKDSFYAIERALSCLDLDFIDKHKLHHRTVQSIKTSFAQYHDNLTIIRAYFATPTLEELAQVAEYIGKATKVFFDSSGQLHKHLSNISVLVESEPILTRIHKLYSKVNINNHYEGLSLSVEQEHLSMMRSVMKVLLRANEIFRAEKELATTIDFNDMIEKASQLLEQNSVVTALRKKIKHLMVDEFQDTDATQYSIVARLATMLATQQRTALEYNADPKVFIVGDGKQSIYLFRGADVRVFMKAKADIIDCNKYALGSGLIPSYLQLPESLHWDNIEPKELHGDILLAESYRLTPTLVGAVNALCSFAMNQTKSAFDISYDEMICARRISTYQSEFSTENASLPTKSVDSRVEILLHKKYTSSSTSSDSDDTRADRVSEAKNIVKHILSIVEGGSKQVMVYDEHSGIRPAQFGDIAIIASKRSSFLELQEYFRQYSMPFFAHGSSGFYQQQEILDCLSILTFLQSPHDDIALASTLRSPFFCVDDTDLTVLTQAYRQEKSLWEKLQKMCESNQETSHPLYSVSDLTHRAYQRLKALLPLALRIPPAQLLRKILDETMWVGTIQFDKHNAAQIEANVRKLIDMARNFEGSGFRNLYDFVEQIRRSYDNATTESEAVVSVQDNAIQLLTIHASKGLEFPIVYFIQTHKKGGSSNNDSLSIHDQFGLFATLKDSETSKKHKTILSLAARQSSKDAQSAENKRLLYVALTRAKDHVFISGTITLGRSNENSVNEFSGLLAIILEGIGLTKQNILLQSQGVISTMVRFADGSSKELLLDIPIIFENSNEGSSELAKMSTTEISASIQENLEHYSYSNHELTALGDTWKHLKTIEPITIGETYSATQLMMFVSSPQEYIRRYRLGMPTRSHNVLRDRHFTDVVDDVFDSTQDTRSFHENIGYMPIDIQADSDIDTHNVGYKISGAIYGTIFHRLIELIALWRVDDDKRTLYSRDSIEKTLLKIADELELEPTTLTKAMLDRARTEVIACMSFPLIATTGCALRNSKQEYTVTIPLGKHFLTGTFDCLLELESGQWEIWDWKTNQISTEKTPDYWLEHYALQLRIYLYFLAHMYPEQTTYTARLIFTQLVTNEMNHSAQTSNQDQDDCTRFVTCTRLEALSIHSELSDIISAINVASWVEPHLQ